MKHSYYNDGTYGPARRPARRRSLLSWLADGVLTLLSLAVGVTMTVTLLVPYVNPARGWIFPVLGLVAPALYVAALMLALYWIIRWRWLRAGTMLLPVVIGFFQVSLFWRPELRRSYGEPKYERRSFKVMSYNLRMFYGGDGRDTSAEVAQLIADTDPDIVCLQEFNIRLAERSGALAALEERYERTGLDRTSAPDSLYGAQMVILSKYRILRSGMLLDPNTAVWADVLMDGDTVRVFNNHLRSTAINASDNAYLTGHGFISDTAREVKIRSIVGRFRDNSVLRAAQVDSLSRSVRATRCRRIVCGDFNDTPVSYAYRTMARGLCDAFSECGSGYSHTYRGFFNTLRIDYVLRSEGFETLSYEVPEVDYSDHLPVVVRLVKRPLNN